MDAKTIFLALFMISLSYSLGFAEDQPSALPTADSSKRDLEALKAQVKEQEDRINKLSREVEKLDEAIKPKTAAPKAEPALAAPAAKPNAAETAGVDNPAPTDTKTHVVAKGETLIQISKTYGVSVDDIKQLNKIEDAKKLQAGQTIKIPQPANATPTPAEPHNQ